VKNETRAAYRSRKKAFNKASADKADKRASARTRGYDTKWQKFRLNFILEWISYGAPCAICKKSLDPIDKSLLEVDHIIPLSERPDLRLQPDNCRVLHKRCHTRRTSQYELDKKRGFSTEASTDGNPGDPAHPWNEKR
jgi:5-methylcytosine-specific restriction endonuclease McrA